MKIEELEEILEGGTETQTIDFKCSCEWDETSFAKDILAFSNVQDGGYILIGVKELANGTFEREGVTETDKQSFKIDVMRDQMSKYADPHVNFTVDFPQDKAAKNYVAIRIFPFQYFPVICKKQGLQTSIAAIYYRNRNRRPESAQVSNVYDMRDIIEVAARRMMWRWRALDLSPSPGSDAQLDEELEGL